MSSFALCCSGEGRTQCLTCEVKSGPHDGPQTPRLSVTGFPVLKSVTLPVRGCPSGCLTAHRGSDDGHVDFSRAPMTSPGRDLPMVS
ncbi:unnamed protein product, partial [Rangifer tarandus platyrhynchus]